jgi:hypothetical protein
MGGRRFAQKGPTSNDSEIILLHCNIFLAIYRVNPKMESMLHRTNFK